MCQSVVENVSKLRKLVTATHVVTIIVDEPNLPAVNDGTEVVSGFVLCFRVV